MLKKFLDLIKWVLIMLTAGAAFYCAYPKKHVSINNGVPILEKINLKGK